MKWLKPGRNNKEERMNFVEYWAEYVKTTPEKVWRNQQKILIDSAVKRMRQSKLTPKQYLAIKGEPCMREE